MRTYQQILDELKSKLTSDAWNRIQNSIVGRELLAYGAQVLSADENVADYLQKSFNYEQADFPSLLVAAAANDIAINKVKPATITIKLQGNHSTVYKPFQLQAVAGSIMFTNIDFCHGNDEVTLYQGSVIRSTNAEDLAFLNYRYEVTNPLDTVYLPSSDTTVYTYLRLGNAHPESVRVQAIYSGAAIEVPPFDPISYGSDVLSYKLKNLPDGTVCVQSGNGTWGASFIDNNSQISIVYLQPSAQEFTNVDSVVNTDNNTNVTYTLISTSSGSNDDIDYARQMYRKQQLKMCGVISKVQVESFVRAFESVLDCKAVVTDNRVTVYVKPADPTNRGTFGEIEMNLAQYGSLLSDYSVLLGRPIEVTFAIYNVPQTMRAAVLSKVQYELDYQKVRFNDAFDIQKMSTLIYQYFGIQPLIRMYTKQKASEVLAAVPIQGTVKFYIAGALKAWDENGAIVGVFGGTYTEQYQSIKSPVGDNNSDVFGMAQKFDSSVRTSLALEPVSGDCMVFGVDSALCRPIVADITSVVGYTPSEVYVMSAPGDYNYVAVYGNQARFDCPMLLVVRKECFWNYPNSAYPFDAVAKARFASLPEFHNKISSWDNSVNLILCAANQLNQINGGALPLNVNVKTNYDAEKPIRFEKAAHTPSYFELMQRTYNTCPFVYQNGFLYYFTAMNNTLMIEVYVEGGLYWDWYRTINVEQDTPAGYDVRFIQAYATSDGALLGLTNTFKIVRYEGGAVTVNLIPNITDIANEFSVSDATLCAEYELQHILISGENCCLQVSKVSGVNVFQNQDGSLNTTGVGMVPAGSLSSYAAKRFKAVIDINTLELIDIIDVNGVGLGYEVISYEGKTIQSVPGELMLGQGSNGQQIQGLLDLDRGTDFLFTGAFGVNGIDVPGNVYTPYPRLLNYNPSAGTAVVGVITKPIGINDDSIIYQQILVKAKPVTTATKYAGITYNWASGNDLSVLNIETATEQVAHANSSMVETTLLWPNNMMNNSNVLLVLRTTRWKPSVGDRLLNCFTTLINTTLAGILNNPSLKAEAYDIECHTYKWTTEGVTELTDTYNTVSRVGTMTYAQEKVKFNDSVTSSTDTSTISMEYESVAKFDSEDSYDVLADNPIVWK